MTTRIGFVLFACFWLVGCRPQEQDGFGNPVDELGRSTQESKPRGEPPAPRKFLVRLKDYSKEMVYLRLARQILDAEAQGKPHRAKSAVDSILRYEPDGLFPRSFDELGPLDIVQTPTIRRDRALALVNAAVSSVPAASLVQPHKSALEERVRLALPFEKSNDPMVWMAAVFSRAALTADPIEERGSPLSFHVVTYTQSRLALTERLLAQKGISPTLRATLYERLYFLNALKGEIDIKALDEIIKRAAKWGLTEPDLATSLSSTTEAKIRAARNKVQ